MSRLAPLAIALLAACGCKGEGTKSAPSAPARDAAPAGNRNKPEPGKQVSREAPNEVDRRDAEALRAAWLAAQNKGDFAGYQKLYGDKFTGVRRSGKQVRRFDRAGWVADRGRMFQKPMEVTVDAVHVIAHEARTHLFFTQTFEQGSYKDTGRKWMALERAADGALRIAREEMLDSTIIARQEKELAAARAGPDTAALAAGAVELGWAGKGDKLYLAPIDEAGRLVVGRASGSIGTGPVTVADHTIDAAAGSLAGVSASRAVDETKLPPALAARLGKTVQLLDAGLAPICHARIGGYSFEVTDWAPDGAAEQDAAAAALLDDAPVVVAELQLSGCPKGAAWARDVDLAPLPEVGDLDAGDEKRIRKALAGATGEESPGIEIVGVAGDPSRVVAAVTGHTEDSCETQEEYRMHLFLLTRKGKRWEATPLASFEYEDTLAAAVDADGDGTVDVFTSLGSHRGTESDFWRHDIRIFWPPGLGCDGCEGPECGGD